MPSQRPSVALIQFPGSNCEWETKRAAEAAGITCDIFRWNRPAELLADYDGYIIGGGFSYQDRVRSGAIAAKEPIVGQVFDEVTTNNKPCLGICNGAQVLVEAGLVPGIRPGEVDMALAPNRPSPRRRIGQFSCCWTYLKHTTDLCRITSKMQQDQVWPVPIAHGEGRFTTSDPELIDRLRDNGQIVFQYCDFQGRVTEDPEVNPNGSMVNIAGICNPEGTVLAMMPHPERCSFLRQVPREILGQWGETKQAARRSPERMQSPAPGLSVFQSMYDLLTAAA